jgi:hypothetical protein
MLALSLIAYLTISLVRIMQLSRVGKFAHRFSVRVGTGCPPYLANVGIQRPPKAVRCNDVLYGGLESTIKSLM